MNLRTWGGGVQNPNNVAEVLNGSWLFVILALSTGLVFRLPAEITPDRWQFPAATETRDLYVPPGQRSLIEKKGQLGLWQCQASVPSALLLNALNFALNFFLFDTAFSNILCQHYRTNNARMLIPSN